MTIFNEEIKKALRQVVANTTNPGPFPARCDNGCGWTGYFHECEYYTDWESWEMPQEYTVHICPKCGTEGSVIPDEKEQ